MANLHSASRCFTHDLFGLEDNRTIHHATVERYGGTIRCRRCRQNAPGPSQILHGWPECCIDVSDLPGMDAQLAAEAHASGAMRIGSHLRRIIQRGAGTVDRRLDATES